VGSAAPTGTSALEGATWTLSDETDLGVPLAGVDVTALFDGGRVAGTSGCNRYTGSYTLQGDALTISPGVAATMMACPAPQMAVEQAYLAALPKVASFAVEGTTLTLRDAGGAALLVYEQISGEQAVAGDWTVTMLRTADAVSSPVPGSTLTLSLANGNASGSAGCNNFNGGFTVDGQQLTFGPLATTRKACADPAIGKQETDYLAALAATRTFSSTSSMLTLLAEDGTITVTLVRAEPSPSIPPTTT
jgi:heat shock protein HslJ